MSWQRKETNTTGTRDKTQSSVWTVGAFYSRVVATFRFFFFFFSSSSLIFSFGMCGEMVARRGEASMETRASRTVIKRKRVVKSSSHSFQPQSPAVRAGGPCRRSANREREGERKLTFSHSPCSSAIGDILSPVKVNITSFFATERTLAFKSARSLFRRINILALFPCNLSSGRILPFGSLLSPLCCGNLRKRARLPPGRNSIQSGIKS